MAVSEREIRKMPCLCSFSWYRAVERTACAERLATPHAMHADTARLAALQDDITALRAFDFLHEDAVALPHMCRNVFALSLEMPTLCTEGFAVLTSF